jgi:DNA helicase-2/ATP-dependent DNA helicase PcrA
MNYDEFAKRYDVTLNDRQKAALTHIDGPVLLVSVPGAGKTTVITARAGYMTLCRGIDAGEILTITFTVAAAKEMKERFVRKFGGDIPVPPHFSTIHSFCMSVLRHAERTHGIHIPETEPDNARIIRSVYTKMTGDYATDQTVKDISRAVTYCKNTCADEAEIERTTVQGVRFPEFFENYERAKRDLGVMDFDDQLILCHETLSAHEDVLGFFQDKYRCIAVDEAQDTSYLQHRIINLLAAKEGNLFMTGDEDQSIYGFRGACPKALLDFEKDHPGAKVLFTETNYRSCSEITDAAGRFIGQNKERREKRILAEKGPGANIRETKLHNVSAQYRHVLSRIKARSPEKTLAVLYRNNESAVPLIDLLLRENTAFTCRDSLGTFLSHPIVTDILALLALALDTSDTESYKKVYHKLGTYTSKQNVSDLEARKPAGECVFEALSKESKNERQRRRYGAVKKGLTEAGGMKPFEAIEHIIDKVGYKNRISEMSSEGYSEASLMHKANTLLAAAQESESIPEFLERMRILENIPNKKSGRVTVSTIHSAKGLEFDDVIILDAFEGVLPSESAVKDKESGDDSLYEEEVRLFYVAATRAKTDIEIPTSNMRFSKPISPSRFVMEFLGGPLPAREAPRKASAEAVVGFKNPALEAMRKAKIPAYPEFPLGTKIVHKHFGEGFITQKEDSKVTVKLVPSGETKSFDLGICAKNDLIRPAEHT